MTIDWFQMVVSVIGGLGLFLYGMKMMSDGMESVAGNKLRKILERSTKNPLIGVLVGTLFTMIVQSSSATTVMVVGFVTAGLMPLSSAIYVIMGANIGTTITAQLIAFNIPALDQFKLTKIAPFILIAGVIMIMVTKRRGVKFLGEALAGFGILFIGIEFMGDALKPLAKVPELTTWMQYVADKPLLGLLLGAGATGVIQSSSAFTGVVQTLAQNTGALTLYSAIYMILGTNIGTCVTAMIASVGTNRMARRSAWFHLMFNVTGAIVFGVVLHFFASNIIPFMQSLTPGDVAWQIANTHTIFNIATVIIFMFIAKPVMNLTFKIVRGQDPVPEPKKLLYVDKHTFLTPTVVVPRLQKEVTRMAELAIANYKSAIRMILKNNINGKKMLKDQEEVINFLNHEITEHLVRANQLDLSKKDVEIVGSLFHVVNDIERIGDHAENLMEYAEARIDEKVSLSDTGVEEIRGMSEKVETLLNTSLEIFNTRDLNRIGEVAPLEKEIDTLEKELAQQHVERLNANQCTPRAGLLFTSILSNMERVADHATNIAYSIEHL